MNLKNDQWQNFTEAVDLLCKHKFCIAKCLAKCSAKFVLRSKITAMQNFKLLYMYVFCIAQTALQKKMTEFDPCLLVINLISLEIIGLNFTRCRIFISLICALLFYPSIILQSDKISVCNDSLFGKPLLKQCKSSFC